VFEFQLLAAAGYTVVYGNPRGGSSFGTGFAAAIKAAYGTVDADDVLAITDDALAKHADPTAPVHLTGGSYGGFMTNWLTARTDRYRSAVTQRSICNWLSFYGTADIGPWFGGEEQGGTPWTDTERLWASSPLKHVANVRTPTLVIHSELDHRCPIEQAEQWFTALKELGVETRMLRFPDEGHDLSRSGRPDRRLERLEAIIGWFDQHP
jgi:dipeptidyl aminopeptidase/acylaminoacyl peptidase